MKELTKNNTLQVLRKHKDTIYQQFSVNDLALFGSVARNISHENSDIDILVSFNGSADSKKYFGLLFYLEDLFQCKVDLVTEKSLRKELRPFIEKEAIHV